MVILLPGGKPGCSPVDSSLKGVDMKLYTLAEFVLSAEIDNMNLYKLVQFCENSKLAHKVRDWTTEESEVTYLKALSWHFHGETEEIHEKPSWSDSQ